MSRRSVLACIAALASTVLVAGCSDPGVPAAGEGDADTVRVAALGNTTDSLNPLTTNGFADYIAVGHLYDMLVELRDGKPRLKLAESIEPGSTASTWTIVLREGLTFSSGAPITAEDVAYSLGLLADPKQSPNYAAFFSDVEVDGIEVLDERRLTVPFAQPRGDFVSTILSFASFVYPKGFSDWQEPVSSGPYTLVSYHAGERISLEAREDYHGGTPKIKHLEVVVIDDPQARMNALKSGEVDVATRIDPVIARAEESNNDVAIQQGGDTDALALGFEMNVNKAPFDDPNVRLAVKLAVDRQDLVDTVLLGRGSIGNDLIGQGIAGYAEEIPQREHDLERSRELFAAAGVTELTLRTSEITPGLRRASELLVEQLKEAGVTLHLETVDPASWFADYDTLLSTPFQVAYYVNRDAGAYLGSFTGSRGFFNISGYAPAGYDESLRQAQAIGDETSRTAEFAEVQERVWSEGGSIVWGYQAVLNATVPGLGGIYLTQGVPHFEDAALLP